MIKPTLKRFGLGLIQHIALAMAILIFVSVAQKSVIHVENLYGELKQHRLDLYDSEERFEDTAVFSDMFDNAVSDLLTLTVIKAQLETDGVYDGEKLIDVTSFVNRREVVSLCPITAVYRLDDLIKWSKSGLEMSEKTFTKKDFVNYFGDNMLGIEHFYLDEKTDELRYQGDLSENSSEDQAERVVTGNTEETASENVQELQQELDRLKKEEMQQKLEEEYNNYLRFNEDYLVDKAFNYLTSHMDKPVTLSYKDDMEYVHLEMIRPRYATAGGVLQLVDIADNWLDYCSLENNLIDTIESLAYNYNMYESRNDLYAEGNTNLSYLVRVPQKDGYIDYTNMPAEYLTEDTAEIDNYFEDIGKYIHYSVDDIDCVGNVDISDEEMLLMVETHKYAYPEGTRIWIGVDTDFEIKGDQFETGQEAFDSIVPRMREFFMLIFACLIIWMVIWSYLTYTAGQAYDEDGNMILYLNGFDKLYTEFVVGLGAALCYAGVQVFKMLLAFAANGENAWAAVFAEKFGSPSGWVLSGLSGLYGFAASFIFSVFWYSLVRRLKSGNLWRDSFLHWIPAPSSVWWEPGKRPLTA